MAYCPQFCTCCAFRFLDWDTRDVVEYHDEKRCTCLRGSCMCWKRKVETITVGADFL